MPVAKKPGDKLIGGTVNGTGSLVMRTDKVGMETMLSRIVSMVAEAQRSQAPIQRVADTVSGYFVPAVLVVAVLAFVAWTVWGPAPALAYGLIAAVSVIIIACPCALGLATPMSIGVGVGKGAAAGVLIKSAEALERMEKVDTLVVDKTGTLTEARVTTSPGSQLSESDCTVGAVSNVSEHPLRPLSPREGSGAAIQPATDFVRSPQGSHWQGRWPDGALGNARLMADLGVKWGSRILGR